MMTGMGTPTAYKMQPLPMLSLPIHDPIYLQA